MNLGNLFKYLAVIVIAFLVGWFSFDLYSYYSNINKEQPFSLTSNELKSPGDWIKESSVKLSKDYVLINISDTRWARFTDTNSMDPVLDADANSIEIRPDSPSELKPGDIISYRSGQGTIIHRIVETGKDEQGWYAITKGDNNYYTDSEKVRFDDIKGVVVAVLY